jgi:hypothetical protein
VFSPAFSMFFFFTEELRKFVPSVFFFCVTEQATADIFIITTNSATNRIINFVLLFNVRRCERNACVATSGRRQATVRLQLQSCSGIN